MAWTDQCRVAFKTNADGLLWKQDNQTKKGIMKILSQLSEDSGIPQKTLYRWWNEEEKQKEKNLKNETSGKAVENTDKTVKSNKIKRAKDGTLRGGRREGAGRKKVVDSPQTGHKWADAPIPPPISSEAMQYVTMAQTNLERIRKDDPKREEALNYIIRWIQNQLSKRN